MRQPQEAFVNPLAQQPVTGFLLTQLAHEVELVIPHSPFIVPTVHFVQGLVESARVPRVPLLYALSYLTRLRSRPLPWNNTTLPNTHGLVLALFIIAYKVIYDNGPNNAWWHERVPKGPNLMKFPLAPIDQMESYILQFLDWDIRVRDNELVRLSNIELLSNPRMNAALKEGISKCSTPLLQTTWVTTTMNLQDTYMRIEACIDTLPPPGSDVFVFKIAHTTVRSLVEHLGLTHIAEECLKQLRYSIRSDSLELDEDGEGDFVSGMSELVAMALYPILEMREFGAWHPSLGSGPIASYLATGAEPLIASQTGSAKRQHDEDSEDQGRSKRQCTGTSPSA